MTLALDCRVHATLEEVISVSRSRRNMTVITRKYATVAQLGLFNEEYKMLLSIMKYEYEFECDKHKKKEKHNMVKERTSDLSINDVNQT